jgi:leucyl aminopeptidase
MVSHAPVCLPHPCLDALIDPPTGAPAPLCLIPVHADGLAAWMDEQSGPGGAWVRTAGFEGKAGQTCPLPNPDGSLFGVLVGLGAGTPEELWTLAALPERLAPGDYRLEPADGQPPPDAALGAAMAEAWALGCYRFDRYKGKPADPPARLVWPEGCDRAAVRRRVEAVALVRDLVNTPACDMGPAELEAAARALADHHGASVRTVVGEALLDEGWPAVHAVGRGSARAPRLIDLRWGPADAPRVTLVGKGVVFDSGGLNLKPSSAITLMKKDMGGAAHALGLAHLIMGAGLPVRLRVLIPAVENMVSGDSFRPLDVLATRKGLTVEVGDTDAEGRLVLADALAEADAEAPALLLDLATLTGAARVALGPDIPAVFSRHDELAADLLAAGERTAEPLWRLPLHGGYRAQLDSAVADIHSTGSGRMGGAITAALFLSAFVSEATPWAHIDLYAWAAKSRPGRPEGGAAQGLNALFDLIARRFAG